MFLLTIVQCISMILLWMLVHTLFGIKMGLLFPDKGLTIWHWVYYLALVASFVLVFVYVRKKVRAIPRFDLDREDV